MGLRRSWIFRMARRLSARIAFPALGAESQAVSQRRLTGRIAQGLEQWLTLLARPSNLRIAQTAICTAMLVTCVFAAPAGAKTEPFAITAFTTQTTEPSPVDETVNEPYFFNQAGGHPFALTSVVRFAAGDPKDIVIDLPPGLLANPQAVAHCSGLVAHCPGDTQVGMFALRFEGGEDQLSVLGAIVNMTPYAGVPSELGLEVPYL